MCNNIWSTCWVLRIGSSWNGLLVFLHDTLLAALPCQLLALPTLSYAKSYTMLSTANSCKNTLYAKKALCRSMHNTCTYAFMGFRLEIIRLGCFPTGWGTKTRYLKHSQIYGHTCLKPHPNRKCLQLCMSSNYHPALLQRRTVCWRGN